MFGSRWLLVAVVCALLAWCPNGWAQNAFVGGFAPVGGQNNGGQNNGGFQGGNQQAGQQGNGFRGGAASADFDSLIDLITSTVGVDSWVDNGGAAADVRPFPGGVWIDPAGVLQTNRHDPQPVKLARYLESPPAKPAEKNADCNPHQSAKLRCVSLPRLEAEIIHRLQRGDPLEEPMLTLAGLQRVQYVFVYPEIGDVVLAGPAGDWQTDEAGRIVSRDTMAPVVRLDDLLTLMRREREQQGKPFGCSITPRQENLAATQAFLNESAAAPLKPGKAAREKWLEELRTTLGRQDIEVFGLEPGTHAAHVLVEADHHMKRVGIGLADGVVGVDSYLDTLIKQKRDDEPLSVLRWWFSTNYRGVAHNSDSSAFELVGQGVKVLSENELLTERGERIHTGRSDESTQQFAHQFTAEFAAIAEKYPVHGELRNLFDLAIVAAMLDGADLYRVAGWQPMLFLDAKHLPLPKYHVPKEVDTILNHRVVDQKKILAAVSGGVWIDGGAVLEKSERSPIGASEKLDYHREKVVEVEAGQWWWNLE